MSTQPDEPTQHDHPAVIGSIGTLAARRAEFIMCHPWKVYGPEDQYRARFSNERCAAMTVPRGGYMVGPDGVRRDFIGSMRILGT